MDRIKILREGTSDFDAFFISSKANIFYYSGFTSDDAYLVITNTRTVLITDSRYTIQARNQTNGFEIYDISEGLENILKRLNFEKLGYEEEKLTVREFSTLKKAVTCAELAPAQEIISKPRQIKSSLEIEKIRLAEELGDAAFSHILTKLCAGMKESDVAFELEFFMRKNGASGLSFETIVASGMRSSMPHGTASDKVIEDGDFVTMDYGCILDGYCSDMTRTVVIGKADSRQREIYNIVLAAQRTALDAVREGILCSEVDKAARDVIHDFGYGKFFSHSLGHSVGLDIHEAPNFSPKSTQTVSAGNVITVEPGIYIDGFGGVRIEDVVAITHQNVENLTKSAKELIII